MAGALIMPHTLPSAATTTASPTHSYTSLRSYGLLRCSPIVSLAPFLLGHLHLRFTTVKSNKQACEHCAHAGLARPPPKKECGPLSQVSIFSKKTKMSHSRRRGWCMLRRYSMPVEFARAVQSLGLNVVLQEHLLPLMLELSQGGAEGEGGTAAGVDAAHALWLHFADEAIQFERRWVAQPTRESGGRRRSLCNQQCAAVPPLMLPYGGVRAGILLPC